MDFPYWVKQTTDKPLYEDLLWSRPENRLAAGKLLIIGGSAHGFAAPAMAYQESLASGVGVAKVLLPDAVKKLIGGFLETAEYAPSTPSGSFSRQALAQFMDLAHWADGVLIAGELGRNSETAIALESFVSKTPQAITITRDAVDYFTSTPKLLLERRQTLIVLSIAQLQRMCIALGLARPVTFGMGLLQLLEVLHQLTTTYPAHIMVKHLENICVASGGQVSTTRLAADMPVWRVQSAARAAVWWLQNPGKPVEAITTALYEYAKAD